MAEGESARRVGRARLHHDGGRARRRSTVSGRRSSSAEAGSAPVGRQSTEERGSRSLNRWSSTRSSHEPGLPCAPTSWRHARRPHVVAMGHRGPEEAIHPGHPQGRDRLVPGLQRARRRIRSGLAQDSGGARRRTSGSSTVRRSGPRRPSTPTTSSCWHGPMRTCPSTPGSRTCSCP